MDQSSWDFFPWNAGGIAVDHISFRFWISGVVSEIFAISRKLSKIALNFGRFFALPNYRGPAFQKLYPCYDPVPRHVVRKMFCGDTPTSPEVIVAKTLNFKANFKFSRLEFFWGTPVPVGVCAR